MNKLKDKKQESTVAKASSAADVSVRYYAWISSIGEKDFYNENEDVLFAGMIKNVPNKYKPLPDGSNGRHYCVITKVH